MLLKMVLELFRSGLVMFHCVLHIMSHLCYCYSQKDINFLYMSHQGAVSVLSLPSLSVYWLWYLLVCNANSLKARMCAQ
jgi:hypothetical protein